MQSFIGTNMHSSRMLTARLLSVSPSMQFPGGCLLLGGVCPVSVYPSMHWGRHPPWTEWLTDRCTNITFANFVYKYKLYSTPYTIKIEMRLREMTYVLSTLTFWYLDYYRERHPRLGRHPPGQTPPPGRHTSQADTPWLIPLSGADLPPASRTLGHLDGACSLNLCCWTCWIFR